MKLVKPQIWHFSLAWCVSLLVHALLVFLLYEIYSEFHAARRPAVVVLARGDGGKTLVLPELAVQLESIPSAAPVLSASRRRPDDVAAPMPRHVSDRTELLAMQPSYAATPHESVRIGRRPRAAAEAAIPVEPVELPATNVAAIRSPSDLLPIAPRDTSLPRQNADADRRFEPTVQWPAPRYAYLPSPGSPRRPVLIAPQQNAPARPGPQGLQRKPASAFAHRVRIEADDDLRSAAIARGLEFLARVQLDDGRWRFDYLRGAVDADAEPVNIRADAAATGLALLAFLGAGHDHFEGSYALAVEDGLQYLLRVQQPSGELFPEDGELTGQVARFYSHGIATLALCEAYGMTGDQRLYQPAQRAIDHLITTQHPQLGGWRYAVGVNADLSVTGWQTAALRSGELAGLRVPESTFARIGECVEMCRDAQGSRSLFRYNPWAEAGDPLTRHGRLPSTVMTAVGVTTLRYLAADDVEAAPRDAGPHLAARLPSIGDAKTVAQIGTLGNPLRDTYYWYYGTQAMFYLGGKPWDEWSRQLDGVLIDSQETDDRVAGSWDPFLPVPDKWAAYGGRLYVTAMNLLSLEIRNRHLRFEARQTPQIVERNNESPR